MSDEGATAEHDGGDAKRHEEILHAEGHEHVQGTHASTFEVTTDDYLTPAGDCIVGIEADRAPADFDDAFVAACQNAVARIVTTLTVRDDDANGGEPAGDGDEGEPIVGTQEIVARGDPELTFESDRSAVWRTSDYVDERTVAVGADGAAAAIDRELIEGLADGATLDVRIEVASPA